MPGPKQLRSQKAPCPGRLSILYRAGFYPDSYQQDGEDGGYHYLFARHGKAE